MTDMTTCNNKTSKAEVTLMRGMYAGFILLSIYFLLFSNDKLSGLSNFALSLAFDPFDSRVKWNDRPRWQRVWLVVHLVLLLGLMVYVFTAK